MSLGSRSCAPPRTRGWLSSRIEKLDPDAQPIYYVALRGPGTPQELTEFADDELKGPLEGLPGVGSVQIMGGREREIGVRLDPARLEALAADQHSVSTVVVLPLKIRGGEASLVRPIALA